MSESDNDKITVKRTLTLKRSGLETGTVKQNFSHGRTKAVVVETKRRKIARPDDKIEVPQPTITKPHVAPRPKQRFEEAAPDKPVPQSNLSSAEMEARFRALEEAHIQEKIMRERAEEQEKRAKKFEENSRLQAIQEVEMQQENENIPQTPTPPLSSSASVKELAESAEIALPLKNAASVEKRTADENKDEDKHNRRTNLAKSEVRAPKIIKGADERRRGKLTLNSALDEEGNARGRSMAAMRRRQENLNAHKTKNPGKKFLVRLFFQKLSLSKNLRNVWLNALLTSLNF